MPCWFWPFSQPVARSTALFLLLQHTAVRALQKDQLEFGSLQGLFISAGIHPVVSTGAELGCTSSSHIKKTAPFRRFLEFHQVGLQYLSSRSHQAKSSSTGAQGPWSICGPSDRKPVSASEILAAAFQADETSKTMTKHSLIHRQQTHISTSTSDASRDVPVHICTQTWARFPSAPCTRLQWLCTLFEHTFQWCK